MRGIIFLPLFYLFAVMNMDKPIKRRIEIMRKKVVFAFGIVLLVTILISVFALPIPISASNTSADMNVIRTLPSSASPGDVITVELDVEVGSASYYAIDEQVPAGWEIMNTTGDTTEKGHVKWLVVSGAKDTTYTYSVKIPATASGKAFFSGKYQMEGMSVEAGISGDTAIQIYATGFGVARILPDKGNAGDTITVELDVRVGSATHYTIDEKVPSGWEVISASGGGDYTSEKGHIKWIVLSGANDIKYTYRVKIPVSASGSYTFSGYYAFEGMPERNIEGDEDITVTKAGVERTLPERATPDSTVEVRLGVKVGVATHYTIDEQVPDGWVITDTSGDTTEPGHVKWIVTSGAKDTTYAYNVTIPSDAEGIYSFNGEYMLEGMSTAADIYGDHTISVGAGIVTRTLPSNVNAGDEITVRLDVDAGTADSYLIDEKVPTGWVISDTTGDTSEKGHVKWNVTSGAVNTVCYYNVSIPFDVSGKYFFDGKYIFEHMSEEVVISGDNCVDVQGVGVSRTLPAVALPDSTIEVELNVKVGASDSYLIDEQVPTGWIITNTTGDTSEEGHVKWNVTSGAVDTVYSYEVEVPSDCIGVYHFTGEYMLEGMTSPNNIRGDESVNIGTGIVTRDLPSSATAGSTIEVVLNVKVGGADYYLIDEQVPEGWEVISASGGGDFTAQEGYVKWCEVQNVENTTYTYNVSIPADISGEFGFSGTYMFAGMESEEEIGGDTYLKVEPTTVPAPIITPTPSGDVKSKEGESVTFSISVNQDVNATWYLNGTYLFTNYSVNEASYTNSSGVVGTWNITVVGVNENGMDSWTWIWTVEKKLIPCYIATATYGTPLDRNIDVLRDFRNDILLTTPIGKAFVSTYYATSPPIADALRENDELRTATRVTLIAPLVSLSGFAMSGIGIWVVFVIGLLAAVAFTLDFRRREKSSVEQRIVKSVLVGTGVILGFIAVIFSLGFLGYTIPSCAVLGAYLLPFVIPVAVTLALCTLLDIHTIQVVRPLMRMNHRITQIFTSPRERK